MSLTSYYAGLCAEKSVASKYARCGFEIMAERFKSDSGEIDVIARHENKLYFIEVKQSKTFERAAAALGATQIKRIQMRPCDTYKKWICHWKQICVLMSPWLIPKVS